MSESSRYCLNKFRDSCANIENLGEKFQFLKLALTRRFAYVEGMSLDTLFCFDRNQVNQSKFSEAFS